jgi:putative Holliday junction resolvase
MARILSIDYGLKRVGIAVTDSLQIIASALTTIPPQEIIPFLKKYCSEEPVACFVLGEPRHADGNETYVTPLVHALMETLKKEFPHIQVVLQDEQFSSFHAKKIIFQSGAKKKKRQDKALIDKVSAALILEDYMRSIDKNW